MPLLIILASAWGAVVFSIALWGARKAIDAHIQADLAVRQVHDVVLRVQALEAEDRHIRGRLERLERWPVAGPPAAETPTADLPG